MSQFSNPTIDIVTPPVVGFDVSSPGIQSVNMTIEPIVAVVDVADAGVPGKTGPQGVPGTPGATGPQGPPSVIQMTQAAYDALTPKNANTLYVIVG